MDFSTDESSSDDEETTPTSQLHQSQQQQELVTRLQLRLAASHLPRVRRFNISRKNPDTFATVVSIFQKDGGSQKRGIDMSASFTFDTANQDEDYMLEWGSTEV